MHKNSPLIAACLFQLAPGEDGAIQLFPAGVFDAPRGSLKGQGPWRIDAQSAAAVIRLAAARKNPILIDYEHQSLRTAENGKPVIAAGWIKPDSLEWRDDGLYALAPEWTAAASGHIAANEMKYLSPVFRYAKDGTVLELISIALTNEPAIDGMKEVLLAAATIHFDPSNPTREKPMPKELLALLGLSDDADEAAVLAACTALKQTADQTAALAQQVAALKSAAPDTSKYVPVEVVTELQQSLAALSQKIETSEIDKLIEANLAKLPTPGLQKWAKSQSVAALTAYLETAPEIAALTGTQTGGRAPVADEHGGDPVAACKAQWDSTPSIRGEFATLEDYTAYKKAESEGKVKIHGAK